ncbi:MAG: TonB family protein [Parabacteroides sp.]
MTPDLLYILKVNVALIPLYLCYLLLFNRFTLFQVRRWMLWGCLLTALLYPMVPAPEWGVHFSCLERAATLYGGILPGLVVVGSQGESLHTQGGFNGISWLYWAGVLFLMGRFLLQWISLFRLRSNCRKEQIGTTQIYHVAYPCSPFSFFRMIFLHPEEHNAQQIEEILTHERAHASQGHSFDMVAMECVTWLCWFNPFVWMFRRELRDNLEFLADHAVLQAGFAPKPYQYHLLDMACRGVQAVAASSVCNHFYVLPLKRRIRMMNAKDSRRWELLKCLFIVPLAALFIGLNQAGAIAGNGGTASDPFSKNEDVLTVVDFMPEYPGGVEGILNYISTHVRYPAEAQQAGEQGNVIVSLIIRKDGSVSDVKVERGATPSLNAEAVRVISEMPKWTPGQLKGNAVDVRYTLPIHFRLE